MNLKYFAIWGKHLTNLQCSPCEFEIFCDLRKNISQICDAVLVNLKYFAIWGKTSHKSAMQSLWIWNILRFEENISQICDAVHVNLKYFAIWGKKSHKSAMQSLLIWNILRFEEKIWMLYIFCNLITNEPCYRNKKNTFSRVGQSNNIILLAADPLRPLDVNTLCSSATTYMYSLFAMLKWKA